MKCIIIDDDKMARDILEHFISKHPELELINQFENPTDAIAYIKQNDVKLIFLDVEMPKMTIFKFF